MVAPEARERAEAAVAAAEADGAEVLLDGRIGGGEAGALLGPTLVEVADPESELAREEVFGPVLALVGVPDLDAAIEFANGSRYGNAGSIFTTSGAAARAYRWGVEAGMLGVNIGVPAPGGLVPVLGLEGLDRRRPARQRPRRGRLLHAQEGRHEPLVDGFAIRQSVALARALASAPRLRLRRALASTPGRSTHP